MYPGILLFRRSYSSSLGLLLGGIICTVGCSSANLAPPKSPFSGNTNVTVLLSSTANDQLVQFGIGLTGITLTSHSKKTVPVFSPQAGTQQVAEFIHVNGRAEPFATVSIPQGIYSSANVTVGDSWFSCVTLTPDGTLDTSMFAFGSAPDNAPATNVTVNLPAPITVTGNSMGLLLDLQVAKSANYSSCYHEGTQPFSISPTFTLTPVQFAADPSNRTDGKVTDLVGEVSAIGPSTNAFTLSLPVVSSLSEVPRTISISVNNRTVYQGLNDFSAIAVGNFVILDGAMQPDGSLSAGRIAIQDPSTSNVSVLQGPVLKLGISDPMGNAPATLAFGTQQQGFLPTNHHAPMTMPYELSKAQFQVSGALSNLQNLPFVPSFNQSNMVAGQNVYITTDATRFATPAYLPAATVTLLPQSINGKTIASSQIAGFTEYTVLLAPDDSFPNLAVQQGQNTLLSTPNQVEVYVDGSTQILTSQPVVLGNTLRFYGMVFNDNGTLRVDCAQINDGVTDSSTPNTATQIGAGVTSNTTHHSSGGIQHMVSTMTRSVAK